MKIKTVINGMPTLQKGFDARTAKEAREIVMALGLCMHTDPILDRQDHCWVVYCSPLKGSGLMAEIHDCGEGATVTDPVSQAQYSGLEGR